MENQETVTEKSEKSLFGENPVIVVRSHLKRVRKSCFPAVFKERCPIVNTFQDDILISSISLILYLNPSSSFL